jgi:hypothetical protein
LASKFSKGANMTKKIFILLFSYQKDIKNAEFHADFESVEKCTILQITFLVHFFKTFSMDWKLA